MTGTTRTSDRRFRVVAFAVTLCVVAFTGGILATHFTSAPTRFGPHEARVSLAFDDRATIDAGPLGTVGVPSDAPLGLGVTVELRDVPDVAGSPRATLTQDDIRAYASLYANPRSMRADIVRALFQRFLLGAVVAVVILGLLYLYPGAARRRALTRPIGGEAVAGIAVSLVAVLTLTGLVGTARLTSSSAPNVDAALAGTSLADARVTGKWMEILVNNFGAEFNAFLNRTRRFYDAAQRHVLTAVRNSGLPNESDTTQTVVLFEGLKCNLGMTRIIGELADALQPAFLLSAGDDSLASNGLETICVDALASAVHGHDLIVAPGNHDSIASQRAMQRRGFHVLDGDVIRESGLQIIGDADPRLSGTFGTRSPTRSETVTQMGERLASTACAEEEPIDVTLVNQPAALDDVVARGCTRLAIAGGIQRSVDVSTTGGRTVVRYLAASAGGAVYDGSAGPLPTLGPLNAPAEVTVLTIGATSHRPLTLHVITVNPDRSATVSPAITLPYASTPAGQRELTGTET